MAKPKDKSHKSPMDRVLAWTKTKSKVELAAELGDISPQALNNWIARGIPPKEHARVAKIYGRSIEVLLGTAEDDPLLADLMTFWDKLLPESKLHVLKVAKYARMTQNPVEEPQTTKR